MIVGQHCEKGKVLYVENEESDALDYLEAKGTYPDREQHLWPSVILLDLNLPGVSGFKVLTWMQKRAEFKALPVVVFSSSP